jgi:hypothetical protein
MTRNTIMKPLQHYIQTVTLRYTYLTRRPSCSHKHCHFKVTTRPLHCIITCTTVLLIRWWSFNDTVSSTDSITSNGRIGRDVEGRGSRLMSRTAMSFVACTEDNYGKCGHSDGASGSRTAQQVYKGDLTTKHEMSLCRHLMGLTHLRINW